MSARQRPTRRATHRARRPRWHTVLPVAGVALLLGLGGTAVTGTLALWSDNATVTTGSVSSGTMDMQLTAGGGSVQAVGLGTNVTANGTGGAGTIAFANLAPGETKAFNVVVSNVGNPAFTWSATVAQGATWTFVNPAVNVQLFAGSASAADTTYPVTESCSGTAQTTNPVSVSGTAQALGSTRTVAGGSTDQMCVVIGIASGALNTNQGKSGILSFAFTANQVAP